MPHTDYRMRDKYIQLIIEYIKEKPGYEQALDNIKKEVMELGATEEEFDRAVNLITNVKQQTSSPYLSQPDKEDFIAENTTQPEPPKTKFDGYKQKALKYVGIAKNYGVNKKYAAAVAAVLIVILGILPFISLGNKPKPVNNANVAEIPANQTRPAAKPLIPVVYANTVPVDAQKIFSINAGSKIQLTVTGKPKKEVLGFFPYWMMSEYNSIDLRTLTSISLFGLETDGNGNIVKQGSDGQTDGGWAMWNDPNLDKLIAKAKSYGLKVFLTIKCFKNGNIDNLATSDSAQQNFIANVLFLINSKNLDGVNIDFEYTGSLSQQTRDGFTRLMTNLNAALKRQPPASVLSIDTYLSSGSEDGLFDISALALNSDYFVIMGYDMHTPNGDPGPVAAMGGNSNIIGYVSNYLEKVNPSQIVLAVPYYGYDWPENVASPSADMVKILPYAEIVQQSQNLQLSWDDTSQTPYFTYKDSNGQERIVHFDNVRSLGIKYDYINSKDLRGVGIWALGYDGQNKDLENLLIDKFINQ